MASPVIHQARLTVVQAIEREFEQTHDENAQAEAARELTSSLGRFIQAGWHVLEPGTVFKPNWHIDAISEHVEAAYRRQITRLMISVPPRHMKSLTASVFAPAWWWTIEPTDRFLTATYSDRFAKRDAIKSRDIISSAWYRNRWGNVFSLKADVNRQNYYANDHQGFRFATTPGGEGTGEGADIIVVDDANKAGDAKRRKTTADVGAAIAFVKDWWGGTLATRLNNPETGVKIVVGQRIHEDDLLGHILKTEGLVEEGGDWMYLCLPARYEPSHPFVWPDDPRTVEGELLWPNHMTETALAKVEKPMPPVDRAGQMQQRPAPAEGTILKRQWLRYFPRETVEVDPPLPPGLIHPKLLVQSWDTAYAETTTSDFVVGQLWGVDGPNRYLLRETRGRLELPDAITAILEMRRWAIDRWGEVVPQVILIEKTANGPKIIGRLQREIPGVVPVNVGRWGKKETRAFAATPLLHAGNVLVPGVQATDGAGPDVTLTPAWVQETVAEWAAFPNAAHDDRVDAFTTAMLWIAEHHESLVAREEPPDEVRRAHTSGLLAAQF